MLALTLSIVTETFPAESRTGAIGTWAAVGGTGFGVGPVAGGILLSFFGWSSVFWVNIPFAVAAVALTLAVVAESRNPTARRLDGPGVATCALGLVGITLGLIEASSHPWGSWPVLLPVAVGAVSGVCFALWERHSRYPRDRGHLPLGRRHPSLSCLRPGRRSTASAERRRSTHRRRHARSRLRLPKRRRPIVHPRIPPRRRPGRSLRLGCRRYRAVRASAL